jgi:ABC-type multidrug transport system fused ATPase/permease subunit
MPDLKRKSYKTKELIKDSWFLLKGYRLNFGFYSFMCILSGIMPFIIAFYLGKIVDFFVKYSGGNSLNPFYFMTSAIALAGIFQIWSRFFVKWRLYYIAGELRMKMRVMAMTKLADLELKWHEKEETGSKIQKIASGGESFFHLFKFYVDSGIPIITGLVGGVVALLFINARYVIYIAAYILIYLYGEYYFNRKIAFWQDQMNAIKEKVSGKIHETAANIMAVKTLGIKSTLKKSVESYESEYFNTSLKLREATQNKFRTIKIFSALIYAIFIFILGKDVISGALSVGSIIIFVGYFDRIKSALDNITNNIADFIELKSGAGRIMLLLDKKTIEKESYPYVNIPFYWKSINFDKISFKYKDKWVLKDFSLDIKGGEKIGIVGTSGSGKSTIAKLLLNLYEPQKGSISIGSVNINKAKSSSLTQTISVVLQDSEMFNMSLKENVAIASGKDIDSMAFQKAVEASELKELINKLPQKENTLIGERGYKVSGGERQRIGIARAIYKNSDVLILDEATSHLDSKTEANIQKNLKSLLHDKTVIIIAHRLSTLKDVDRIVVVDNGKIIESGTFDSLISKKGKFYELYKLQKGKN